MAKESWTSFVSRSKSSSGKISHTHFVTCISLLFYLAIFPISSADCQISFGPEFWPALKRKILAIQSAKKEEVKDNAAENLFIFIEKKQQHTYSKQEIISIASLLGDPSYNVNFFAVASLGRIGPPAQIISPKLQSMFAQTECWKQKNHIPRYMQTLSNILLGAMQEIQIQPQPFQCDKL